MQSPGSTSEMQQLCLRCCEPCQLLSQLLGVWDSSRCRPGSLDVCTVLGQRGQGPVGLLQPCDFSLAAEQLLLLQPGLPAQTGGQIA